MKTGLPSFLVLFVNCGFRSQIKDQPQRKPLEVKILTAEEGESLVLGNTNRVNLNTQEFMTWFQPTYESQNIPEGFTEDHISLSKNLNFKLFLGKWFCDTKLEFGLMFKILNVLEVRGDDIEMYSITEFKDRPEGFEKEYDILYISIFIENGEEINRIVEFPITNLLDDFSKILNKKLYKNVYFYF